MNKQELLDRVKEIEVALQKENATLNQTMANINMLEGGKQECLFWIAEIDKKTKWVKDGN